MPIAWNAYASAFANFPLRRRPLEAALRPLAMLRNCAECCPRTIDILSRFAGVSIHPRYTERDTDDIIAAIRKVYPAVARA